MDQLKPQVLVVDGYNIIGCWDELKSLKVKDMGSARDQLISTLSAFHPWSWERIIIVFDGQSFDWSDVEGVEVVFTEGKETADTMIEKLAAGLAARYCVEVATSDYAEYRAASALGARTLSAVALKERLAEQRQIYSRRLGRKTDNRGIALNELLNQTVISNLERLRAREDG